MYYRKKKYWKYYTEGPTIIELFQDFGYIKHPMFTIDGCHMTIEDDYRWDGTSGGVPDLLALQAPSAMHDVFFQCLREGLVPEKEHTEFFLKANQEFNWQVRENGIWSWVAKGFEVALNKLGKKHTVSDILVAPLHGETV